jgi:ATP adenylyltransferase
VLCEIRDDPEHDEENFVLLRSALCYVVLNRYPYTTGHLMIVPRDHVERLREASEPALQEMARLARTCEELLQGAFRPDGFNLGMNIGRAGGAGIERHLHLHLVPRWIGDTSFITLTGDTRVVPHDLETVYQRLRPLFPGGERGGA